MPLFQRTCRFERMNIERFFARAFVILGGGVWTAAFFSAPFAYQGAGVLAAAGNALIPLALTVVVFAVGLVYEYLAAAILLGGAVVVTLNGIAVPWSAGEWFIMIAVLLGPMVVSALLYILAARMQTTCELRGVPRRPAPTRQGTGSDAGSAG